MNINTLSSIENSNIAPSRINSKSIIFALTIRSILFLLFGLLFVFLISFKSENPWNEVVKW